MAIIIFFHKFFFSKFIKIASAETILGRHSTLEVRSIHLGGLFHAEEEIQMTSTMPNFIGQLQGFIYNGHRLDIFFNKSIFYYKIKLLLTDLLIW